MLREKPSKRISQWRVGGRRKLVVPPHRACGERGRPPVTSESATLVFEIELISIP
jgi:peptidylprolyl isomerase